MSPQPVDRYDRSFAGYLRTIRDGPGLGWRVGTAAVFGLALALDRGVRTLALVVVGVAVVAVVVVYPIYRFHGPGPFGRRRA